MYEVFSLGNTSFVRADCLERCVTTRCPRPVLAGLQIDIPKILNEQLPGTRFEAKECMLRLIIKIFPDLIAQPSECPSHVANAIVPAFTLVTEGNLTAKRVRTTMGAFWDQLQFWLLAVASNLTWINPIDYNKLLFLSSSLRS